MSNAAAYSTAMAVAFAFTISSGMIKSVLAEMDADVTLCNCTKQLGSLHAVSARRAVTKDRCAATSKSSTVASMVKTSVITVDSFVTMVADAGKGEYGGTCGGGEGDGGGEGEGGGGEGDGGEGEGGGGKGGEGEGGDGEGATIGSFVSKSTNVLPRRLPARLLPDHMTRSELDVS